MKPITILVLAANPNDVTQLKLTDEVKAIGRQIQRAEFRDRFQLVQYWGTEIQDLQKALMHHDPQIVHFLGHGHPEGNVVLEDSSGLAATVSAESLVELFAILDGNTRCVVLNACSTEKLARRIADSVDCAVGMSGKISDATATAFAAAFYRGLGFGRNVEDAVKLGFNEIKLNGLTGSDLPKLFCREGVDPSEMLILESPSDADSVSAEILGVDLTTQISHFSVRTLRNGQDIHWNDLPLTIEGQYSAEDASAALDLGVWVVLQDTYGAYYLQNPRVTFLSDWNWIATNVLPGARIALVHFVRMDAAGHQYFERLTTRNHWGAIKQLPRRSHVLLSIRINRVDDS